MKGILMAGGHGSRLRPVTRALNKHLLAVYDKPMIYYPLTTLMLAGARDIFIIVPKGQKGQFDALLGSGDQFGVTLNYVEQRRPAGIAEAFSLTASDIGQEPVGLILGDNILHGHHLGRSLALRDPAGRAQIFSYQVRDPRPYAVIETTSGGHPLSLEEKPEFPKSSWAVPGLYFYPADVFDRATELRPSDRGELEITDLNRSYLDDGLLDVLRLPRGTVWFDGGTPEDLLEAAKIVAGLFERQGLAMGSPEEVAWRNRWISTDDLRRQANDMKDTAYGRYLDGLTAEEPLT